MPYHQPSAFHLRRRILAMIRTLAIHRFSSRSSFLLSGGSVSALRESAVRRGELDEYVGYGVDISHVFYGHGCRPGTNFELSSSDSQQRLAAKIVSLEDIGEAADQSALMAKRRRRLDSDEEPVAAFGLSLVADGQQPIVLPMRRNCSTCSMRSLNSAIAAALRWSNQKPFEGFNCNDTSTLGSYQGLPRSSGKSFRE